MGLRSWKDLLAPGLFRSCPAIRCARRARREPRRTDGEPGSDRIGSDRTRRDVLQAAQAARRGSSPGQRRAMRPPSGARQVRSSSLCDGAAQSLPPSSSRPPARPAALSRRRGRQSHVHATAEGEGEGRRAMRRPQACRRAHGSPSSSDAPHEGAMRRPQACRRAQQRRAAAAQGPRPVHAPCGGAAGDAPAQGARRRGGERLRPDCAASAGPQGGVPCQCIGGRSFPCRAKYIHKYLYSGPPPR